MHCNIDAKGKAVRLIMGGILTLIGVGLAMLWVLGDREPRWPLWSGAVLILAGGVAIVEGWAGWCVVRAMGFRTKF
jgi:hypothetical protein